MIPTIGRRVWYWPTPEEAEAGSLDPHQAFDAGVVFVHAVPARVGSSVVNRVITKHNGGQVFFKEAVELYEPHGSGLDHTGLGGYATWMPYQVAAALKDSKVAQIATDDWRARADEEHLALCKKIEKLDEFIQYNDSFGALSTPHQELLHAQLVAMNQYEAALAHRLALP